MLTNFFGLRVKDALIFLDVGRLSEGRSGIQFNFTNVYKDADSCMKVLLVYK